MSIVTVRNVEAKRLLLEEIPQIVQHHEGSPQVVQLQDDDCMEGCHMRCIPNNRITPCLCNIRYYCVYINWHVFARSKIILMDGMLCQVFFACDLPVA
ncbi:predicted protein [Arabidopsis lyrata subsp. lyrata]|uniref:Predicted protein n=1 Tax=Arabidopsis lyrata subsp. lyrata TaxID=81972 RepID=D7MNM9_ARALL|nr:predicted protein [Arabidopsis lyrata subsp. lyrata]